MAQAQLYQRPSGQISAVGATQIPVQQEWTWDAVSPSTVLTYSYVIERKAQLFDAVHVKAFMEVNQMQGAVYTHFGEANCSTANMPFDHLHINLIHPLLSTTGRLQKASQTKLYNWLLGVVKRFELHPLSCQKINSNCGYRRYMQRSPRELIWASDPKYESWLRRSDEDEEDLMDHQRACKQTPRASSFRSIMQLVEQSGAKDYNAFVCWSSQQSGPVRDKIIDRHFCYANFEADVRKAIQWLQTISGQLTWIEALTSTYDVTLQCPRKYMGIERSVELIEKWASWNKMSSHYLWEKIEDIVDQKKTKVNTLLLVGPSNGGKTLLLRSVAECFRKTALLIGNNNAAFLHQTGIGARIWVREEGIIIDANKDLELNYMAGVRSAIHRKNKESVEQEIPPYLWSCNVLPWDPVGDPEVRKAFRNRCHVIKVEEAPWLQHYNGYINPKAWLQVRERANKKIADGEMRGYIVKIPIKPVVSDAMLIAVADEVDNSGNDLPGIPSEPIPAVETEEPIEQCEINLSDSEPEADITNEPIDSRDQPTVDIPGKPEQHRRQVRFLVPELGTSGAVRNQTNEQEDRTTGKIRKRKQQEPKRNYYGSPVQSEPNSKDTSREAKENHTDSGNTGKRKPGKKYQWPYQSFAEAKRAARKGNFRIIRSNQKQRYRLDPAPSSDSDEGELVQLLSVPVPDDFDDLDDQDV